jgi:hypothetical protein
MDEVCRWRDSNPQPFRDLFLRQARIPFRHIGSTGSLVELFPLWSSPKPA